MIVVLIIGILMAIAVPQFIQARTASQTNTCIANLKQIDAAKQQWAMATGQSSAAQPQSTDLAPNYIRAMPVCPAQGTYTIGDMSNVPTCTVSGHVLQ